MKNTEELKVIANDILDGKIFLEFYLPDPKYSHLVFLPLMMIKNKELLKPVTMLYQYMDKSVSTTPDGYPVFDSMKYLTSDELESLTFILKEIENE